MPDLPLQFPWHVAQSGYQWLEARSIDESDQSRHRFLTDGRPIGAQGYRARLYQPLSAFSGLFRVFADLTPAPEAIKGFADRFGPLGGDIACHIPLHHQATTKGSPLGTGEAMGSWVREMLIMQHAIDLWESARQGDVERLSRIISWNADGSGVQIHTHPELERGDMLEQPTHVDRGWIAASHLDNDVLARFIPGDLIKPALHRMQTVINEQLHRRAFPRLLWDAHRERLGLYIVPDGLIGALWLQFARAVERDSQFRQCTECGIWFELARGTARSDKLYCSTPCRTKAYRKRQVEAVRLHGEGRSLDDIARELDSDPDTVRGWIERKGAS